MCNCITRLNKENAKKSKGWGGFKTGLNFNLESGKGTTVFLVEYNYSRMKKDGTLEHRVRLGQIAAPFCPMCGKKQIA